MELVKHNLTYIVDRTENFKTRNRTSYEKGKLGRLMKNLYHDTRQIIKFL